MFANPPEIEVETSSSADDEDRVYLSLDPEYTFGLATILAYVIYLPPKHHIRSVFYRYLVIAAPRFICSWLWIVTDVYYESVLKENHLLMSQGFLKEGLFQKIYAKDYQAMQSGKDSRSYYLHLDTALLLYVPLITAFINMLLLYFLAVRPRNICQALSWTEEDYRKPKARRWGSVPKDTTDNSSRKHLFDNLTNRLSRLLNKSFWRRWWDDRVCKFSPLFKRGKSLSLGSKVDVVKQLACVLLLFPVQMVYVLIHSLPCFAVFNNLYTHPVTFLLGDCCVSRSKYVKVVLFVTALIMTVAGIALWYWVILEVFWFSGYVIVFLSIDILRNSTSSLSSLVFVFSVVLYVRSACDKFEEKYRQLKLDLFTLLEKYPGTYVLRSDGQTRLFKRHRSGCVSIPRCLFDHACKRYHPYRHEVFKTLRKLSLTLFNLMFVFTMVVKLQVFSELTTTGQGIVMAATASLPVFFGSAISSTEMELGKAAILQGMQTIIEDMFVLEKDGH